MINETQPNIRAAVETMLEEAHKIATGELPGATYEDVFGEELSDTSSDDNMLSTET